MHHTRIRACYIFQKISLIDHSCIVQWWALLFPLAFIREMGVSACSMHPRIFATLITEKEREREAIKSLWWWWSCSRHCLIHYMYLLIWYIVLDSVYVQRRGKSHSLRSNAVVTSIPLSLVLYVKVTQNAINIGHALLCSAPLHSARLHGMGGEGGNLGAVSSTVPAQDKAPQPNPGKVLLPNEEESYSSHSFLSFLPSIYLVPLWDCDDRLR